MKDITDILQVIQETDKQAQATHQACTEHASKLLSEEDYHVYEFIMVKLTALMADMADREKIHVFREVLASLNAIMADGEKLHSELHGKDM